MNIERILNMIIRQITRRAVNKGIDMSVSAFSRSGQPKGDANDDGAEHARGKQGKAAAPIDAKQTRQMARMARRIGRF